MTVKRDAADLNVSERMIYMCRRLRRSGRDDLVAACDRGEMTVHRALQIAENTPKPTRLDKLFTAWRLCSSEDRKRFLIAIGRFP